MAASAIRPDPTSTSNPASGRIGVAGASSSVPIVPSGWAMATGTGIADAGSAETAAANGSSAIMSKLAVVPALRIARMLTTFTPVTPSARFPPLPARLEQRFSRLDMVQAVCHAKTRLFSSIWRELLRPVHRDMPTRDKQFLSNARGYCRGSISRVRGNVAARIDRIAQSGPFPGVSRGCTVEIEN
jgi:hypothetical protein